MYARRLHVEPVMGETRRSGGRTRSVVAVGNLSETCTDLMSSPWRERLELQTLRVISSHDSSLLGEANFVRRAFGDHVRKIFGICRISQTFSPTDVRNKREHNKTANFLNLECA